MKLTLALVAAVHAQFRDSDYTFDDTNNGAVSQQSSVTHCTKCDVTGASTTATYNACHLASVSEECPANDLNQPSGGNAYVCGYSAIKNALGQVVSLKTGCQRHSVSFFIVFMYTFLIRL